MSPPKLLKAYVDADVLFRAATASHNYTASVVLLRLSEFTLIDLVTAVHAVDEAVHALERYLPERTAILLQLIARSIRTVDDPPAALLNAYHDQAHWKDVINLATAVHTQSPFLLTFNVRDYYPAANTPQIITPGQFVTLSRQAIYRLGHLDKP
jgi:hypothetical protein